MPFSIHSNSTTAYTHMIPNNLLHYFGSLINALKRASHNENMWLTVARHFEFITHQLDIEFASYVNRRCISVTNKFAA